MSKPYDRYLQDMADAYERNLRVPARNANSSKLSWVPSVIVTGVKITANAGDFGNTVEFTAGDLRSVASIALQRSKVGSTEKTTVLTWDPLTLTKGDKVSYNDRDIAIANQDINYWLKLMPAGDAETALNKSGSLLGPFNAKQHAYDTTPPTPVAAFYASHSAVSNGVVQVTVAFQRYFDDRYARLRVYAKNYLGDSNWVLVADGINSPFTFAMQQTGETVTLKAVATNHLAIEDPNGPTVTLTLDPNGTVPNRLLDVLTHSLPEGLQIDFLAGGEPDIIDYLLYRGPRDDGFSAATNIATISPSGYRTTFLDTTALGGRYEYYLVARNGAGSSEPTDAFVPDQLLSSALLPPNIPSNSTNFAVVTSIDGGNGTAIIQIHGTGGVGSAWVRVSGFGNETYRYGTISGKAQATKYYVMYNRATDEYLASLDYPSIIGDNLVWAGTVTTWAPSAPPTDGGGGGTGGGGGCADVESWLRDDLQVKNVKIGDVLDCFKGGEVVRLPVLMKERKPNVDCYRLSTDEGSVVIAWDTPCLTRDNRSVLAKDMDGETIFTDRGWRIVKLEHVGPRDVMNIYLGGVNFAAREAPGGVRIYTHNLKAAPDLP